MIATVSLRLLYLIFLQVLGLILMMSVQRHPRTSSCSVLATSGRGAPPNQPAAPRLDWADRAVFAARTHWPARHRNPRDYPTLVPRT